MKRQPYPTDLNDQVWAILEPLIPPVNPGGRPRTTDMREVINALLYVLRSGGPWRLLPHEFPPWQTVYHYFRQWRLSGVWEFIHTTLRTMLREASGRQASPSAGIVDSQSVKTTHRGGSKGFDGAKKVKGRKRHLLVDTQGLLMKVKVHTADLMDWDGGKLVLNGLRSVFPRMRLIWVDGGYQTDFADWVKQHLGWQVEVVKPPARPRGVIAQMIDPEVFAKLYPKGFRVLPRRWVVERTFAWLDRYRRLSRDYEYLMPTSEAFIYVAMSHLMVRRLARKEPS